MRGLHAAPGDSILRRGPRQDGKGEEEEGRSRQPFSLTVQNTETRSRDAGWAWNEAPRPAPPGAQAGEPGSPQPGPRPPREEPRVRTPPSPSSLPSIQLLAPEKRAVPAWLATHRTTQASSLQKQDTQKRQQVSVPGQGRPWVHPRPKGDGRQSVSRGCRRRNQGGCTATPEFAARRARPAAAVAAAASSSSSAGGGPLPPSRLGLGLSLSADGLRAVRFSCVTSSCSSSRSGGFTFHWSPPLSPLRAWSLCGGLLLAPGAEQSTGR